MLELARRARGHFVTLTCIEICMRLIRVKPGHISIQFDVTFKVGLTMQLFCHSDDDDDSILLLVFSI